MSKKNDISLDKIRDWLTGNPETPPSEEDILQSEEALLQFAKAHALAPPASLRDKILEKISTFHQQTRQRRPISPGAPPMLGDSPNWLDWAEAVAGIEPPPDFENLHLHPLVSDERRELFVAWVKEYVEEEVHYDLLESFLILEGSCECTITGESGNCRIVRLGQGGFITMQLGETHHIRITSPQPVKAILEWKKLAA